MTEKPTHPVVKAAIAMRCRRETMKRGRSCLILMRSFSTMVTPTLKSTDGAVSHWKYTIGNVIAYRDMYRADLRGRGLRVISGLPVICSQRLAVPIQRGAYCSECGA